MRDKLTPIFHTCIDMEGTVEHHSDVFEEFTSYMDSHMAEYCVNFEDKEGTWVPIELIKHIFQSHKNFPNKAFKVHQTSREHTPKEGGYGHPCRS